MPLGGNLTITRDNSDNEGNGTQVFVYEIKNEDTGDTVFVTVVGDDSVTVYGLPFGNYTVTQQNDWSSRFADDAQTVELNRPTGTEVTFDDDASLAKWLNGNGGSIVNGKAD